MSESLNFLTNFTEQTFTIAILLCVILLVAIIGLWFYNRKKFHKLSHQVPASVVKNYLDSIIQNSNALKSSLFRGGGLDLDASVPSVMPLEGLASAPSSGDAHLQEELNRKIAEISSLQAQLSDKNNIIQDLEARNQQLGQAQGSGDNSDVINSLNAEIADLKAKLADSQNQAPAAGGGDEELQKQLAEITKERDELKERLMEYEIIEEDLANLKRLQQENEQLKKSLEGLQGGGAAPAAEAPAAEEAPRAEEAAPAEEEAPAAEEAPAEEEPTGENEAAAEAAVDDILNMGGEAEAEEEEASEEVAPEDLMAALGEDGGGEEASEEAPAAEAPPPNDGEQKSAEELLSEFEKMLG